MMTAEQRLPGPGEPGYEHQRPHPQQEACRPDVVARVAPELLSAIAMATPAALFCVDDIRELVDAVEYLRKANERHCNEERDLKVAREHIGELERRTRNLAQQWNSLKADHENARDRLQDDHFNRPARAELGARAATFGSCAHVLLVAIGAETIEDAHG